ncbi:TctC [Pigmentiphaga sp. NML030171]|nr:TctC [Pigmentiphaga sp. NML030171]
MTIGAQAQEFPTRPVKITSSFSVGAGPDVALRLVADKLSKKWNQPVIVENKPGANGFIAVEAGKRARPDGYELVQMDAAQMVTQPFLFKNLPYDLLTDFEPVTPIFRNYFFIVVPTASPYKNVGDLVNAAKAKPDSINYGSWMVGSPAHYGTAMLEDATGAKMTHIPYKDIGGLYVAVGNNEVDWAFGSAGSAGPMYRAGRVRYLAVSAPVRDAAFPDVPTVAESGGPAGFELSSWVSLVAPKGTPKAVVEKIQKDVADIMQDPEVRERYATMFYEPYALNSAQFHQLLKTDTDRIGATLKRLNISLD